MLSVADLLQVPLVDSCYQRVIARHTELAAPAFTASDAPESLGEATRAKRNMLRRALVHELIDYQVNQLLAYGSAQITQAMPRSAEQASRMSGLLDVSQELKDQKQQLERFLYQRVYRHPRVVQGRERVQQQLRDLFDHLHQHPADLPPAFRQRGRTVGEKRAVADYLAGMTDRFCLAQFRQFLTVRSLPVETGEKWDRSSREGADDDRLEE